MKVLKTCLGVSACVFVLGGMAFVWNACGGLQEFVVGLVVMALVIFGWPT